MLRLLTKKLKSQTLNDIKPGIQGSSIVYVEQKRNEEKALEDISIEDIENKIIYDEEIIINNKDNKENLQYPSSSEYNNNNNYSNTEQYGKLFEALKSEKVFVENLVSTCGSNDTARIGGEKRKFSSNSLHHLKYAKVIPTYHCDSSSDEEIKELYSKHECRNSTDSVIGSMKRNRKIVCIERCDINTPRPSLNFEKMREKLLRRPQPRVVKLKTVQSSRKKELNEMVAFKPIRIISGSVGSISESLVPVEEPGYVF